jgi:hypothetical protein
MLRLLQRLMLFDFDKKKWEELIRRGSSGSLSWSWNSEFMCCTRVDQPPRGSERVDRPLAAHSNSTFLITTQSRQHTAANPHESSGA